MSYKPVKVVALENEAERLEKLVYKALCRMDEIQTELDEIEAAKKSKKEAA